jgi:outer membrane protein assembly factor BamB
MRMSRKTLCRILLLTTAGFPGSTLGDEPATTNWPQFRGPNASGVADGHRLPTRWNAADGTHIKWKTPILGLGHSCPIIWGDRLFVTTAVSGKKEPYLRHGLYGDVASVADDTEHTWHVLCLNKQDGKILWEREAYSGVPKFKRHMKATHANSTPATDGTHVVACFGAEGLYCYDFDGNLKWKKDLGALESGWYMMSKDEWGFGSSPIIHDDKVILLCDVQRDPFIAAFDVRDGHEIWRTPRSEVCTWGSPTVVKGPTRTEIVVNGHRQIAGYDPQTGTLLWQMQGSGDIPTPTPIFAHGLIFLHSAHGMGSPVYAVKPGATGDITLQGVSKSNDFVAWHHPRGGPYMPTGIAYGDYYYTPDDRGVMTCYQPQTGEKVYKKRVADGAGGGYTASPVAGDGKLYLTSEDGEIFVVKAGAEYELLAQNSLGEPCLATPAISAGVIYFRTLGHVIAVAE